MLDKDRQIALAEKLQTLWLERMEKLLTDGTITSTDMATLVKFLMANGWTLNRANLPQGLRDKLTEHVSPADFDNSDVIPLRRQG